MSLIIDSKHSLNALGAVLLDIDSLKIKIDKDLENLYKELNYQDVIEQLDEFNLGFVFKPLPHLITSFKKLDANI